MTSTHPDGHANRRRFLQAAAATTAATLLQQRNPLFAATTKRDWPICCFAKPLQHLTFDALADKIAEMGFQGIEATVRKGGQIEPKQVPKKLPQLVETLAKRGLQVTIMTSDVLTADEPDTDLVLRTAADLGIKRYRMKYFRYDLDQPIYQQLEQIKPKLHALAALNRKIGIQGLYQNHANYRFVGGPVWDLHYLLREIDPAEIAIAFDIRHATVEGGQSWPIEFRLMQSQLGAIYIKDFVWNGRKTVNVPLGEGRVDPKFFSMLKKTSFAGPISLHMEYIDHRDPKLINQSLAAIAKDIGALKKLLE